MFLDFKTHTVYILKLKEDGAFINYWWINTFISISIIPPKSHVTYNQVYCGYKSGTQHHRKANPIGKLEYDVRKVKHGVTGVILLEEQYKANGVAILFS